MEQELHQKDDARAAQDARFMALALTLGQRGLGQTWPNPSVGAIIIQGEGRDAQIVGRGITQPGGRPHAETEAVRRAGEHARGGTLYVTLEPCSHHGKTPPCADAIIAAGISRVVAALEDPNPEVAGCGFARLRNAGITVDRGIGTEEARRAHAGHISRVTRGRPHVLLKLAVSADGKVGLAERRPVTITGPAARDRVHLMRAQHDAVMTGIGTVLADDPQLTCRLPGMAARSPVRVVLDSRLRLPTGGALASSAKTTPLWVIRGAAASADRARDLVACDAEIFQVNDQEGKVDLPETLRLLAERRITRLMVECGPRLATALLAAGLVDEVAVFRATLTIGADGLDALDGMPLTAITHSPNFQLRDTETIGMDRLEIYERN